ncbi:MAG: hypothetical protein HYV95_03130 [Opitutae bacterium]|nr:hypothetical protein [Opitutae bacterium]
MRERPAKLDRVRVVHRYAWLWEPLEMDATFVLRAMFGARAAYLDGKLMLCFTAGDEPWRGVLVCTDRAHHAALQAEFPELVPHPILPKWLYLPEAADSFERAAAQLVGLARRRDPRIGVVPQPKKRRAPAKRSRARGK